MKRKGKLKEPTNVVLRRLKQLIDDRALDGKELRKIEVELKSLVIYLGLKQFNLLQGEHHANQMGRNYRP